MPSSSWANPYATPRAFRARRAAASRSRSRPLRRAAWPA
jgi:hypothetical protein